MNNERSLAEEITEGFKALEAMRNNEPVAYVEPYDLERLTHYDCHIGSQKMKNGIPLYTHPVKELTDVEISLIAEEFTGADGLDVVDFGRAILRKAQEK
jgi:hypothetical protein